MHGISVCLYVIFQRTIHQVYFTLGRYVAEEQRKCSVDAVLTYNHSILIHLE